MNKILVINNDIDTMDLLKQWLESKSYQVKYSGSREAIPAIIENFQPGLVIADILQYHIINDLRKNPGSSKIPILMMSGYTNSNPVQQLDVDDVIEKPFNLVLLKKKVEALITK